MISIQQMHYILALSEERQFQRASEKCFVTQPTLSMQLRKAEESLGNAIFDRSRSPIELTEFGEHLLPIIRDVLNENAKVDELVARSKGVFKERIRVAVIPTIAGYLIPDMFAVWRNELEGVQLSIEELKTEDALQALEEKRIDLAIMAGPVADPKLRTTVLFQEEIKAFTKDMDANEIEAEELIHLHPWLLTEGNCLRTQMIHFCSLQNPDEDEWNYQGGNIRLLVQMVERHGGYTLVPENFIDSGAEGYLTIRSSTNEVPAREVIALTSNRTTKWGNIEKIIRSIQLKYGKGQMQNSFQLLSWK